MKKKLCVCLAALMVLGSMAGCGSSPSKEKETAAFEAKDPSEYSGTITIWSWTDDPKYQIEAFNKVYPNVKVEFTQIGEDYDVKMQTIWIMRQTAPTFSVRTPR